MPKFIRNLLPRPPEPNNAGTRPFHPIPATPTASGPKESAGLVNLEEIAATLNVSKRQVQKMMRSRAIPFVTLGRRCVRFDSREVLAFVKKKYGIAAMDADTR